MTSHGTNLVRQPTVSTGVAAKALNTQKQKQQREITTKC